MIYTPCQTITQNLGKLFTCQDFDKGFTRIRTPYIYPDGDVIDLFFKVCRERPLVTDLGGTKLWLLSQSIHQSLSNRQKEAYQDILLTHNVEDYQGALVIWLSKTDTFAEDTFAEATIRLAQAAIAVSNLCFLYQQRIISTLDDEITELLTGNQIRFKAKERLQGSSGRKWVLNFHTFHSGHDSLIHILQTDSKNKRSYARKTKANHVVSSWMDLSSANTLTKSRKFISLFDDSSDCWEPEIIRQLQNLSHVAYWSDLNQFLKILIAGM